MAGTSVSIKLQLSPETQRFVNSQWTAENSSAVMQIVEDELAMHNFPNLIKYNQGVWAPLSPSYRKWKDKRYPGRLKWELTGSAMQALTTPAKIGPSGGNVGAKTITMSTPRPGVVSAEYKFRKPAAGGYFLRNNRMRPIWDLMIRNRAAIEKKIAQYLTQLLPGSKK